MAFDKTVEARLWGTTGTATDVRLPVGDSSGGTFTAQANPLRGTLLWDRCMYVLRGVSLTGTTVTAGSFTVTIETDAVVGYTGLPIARATLGFNSPSVVVMDSLHQSPASPLPTTLFIDRTAGSGTVTLQCHALARQYRGVLGTPGAATSERILQGNLIRGTSSGGTFATDRGIDEDVTFTLGTSGSTLGMHRMRLWDSALYWAVAGNTVAGTHDVDIIGRIGGVTFSIASTGTGGALDAAGEKLALSNNFYGQSPNPTAIVWTEVTAGGVSDARVVLLAKSGRGAYAKD